MNVAALSAVAAAPGSAQFAEQVGRLPAAEQRRVVAGQVEAILLRQLLAPALASLPGAGNGIYGYLLTDAFAQKLSAGRGLGFARLLERQLTATTTPAAGAPRPPAGPAAPLP